MKYLLIIVSFVMVVNCFGQQNQPDSLGFTSKAEAKNLMVNGLKEGKWFEHLDGGFKVITDSTLFQTKYDSGGRLSPYTTCYYSLSMYKGGKHNGVTRWYNLSWGLWCEYPYTDDKVNGVYRSYYPSGQLEWATSFKNDISDGPANEYYNSGKQKQQILYKNGKIRERKFYDENGNEIVNGVFKDYNDIGKLISETTIKNSKERKTKYHYYDRNWNEIK